MKLKNNSDAAPVAVVLRKSDSTLRWLILVLNCIVMVGVYYTFDFPAAMKTQVNTDHENVIYILHRTHKNYL